MKPALLLSLLALLPAAANAKAPTTLTILAVTCNGDRQAVSFPAAPSTPTKQDGEPCCAKACHTGNCRKRCQRTA